MYNRNYQEVIVLENYYNICSKLNTSCQTQWCFFCFFFFISSHHTVHVNATSVSGLSSALCRVFFYFYIDQTFRCKITRCKNLIWYNSLVEYESFIRQCYPSVHNYNFLILLLLIDVSGN